MKKFLVATTAIVAVAAIAGQAQAADPIKLSVGGFMQQWVGYVDQDKDGQEDYAEVLVQSDTELYFRGSTKLDNGLTVGVQIDKYADRGDSGASDDVFMSISSDTLGMVRLGATKGASYGLSHGAPDVGIGHNDGDVENWIKRPTSHANARGTGNYINQTQVTTDTGNDGHKIVYLTPNFGGFQAGFSYGLNANGVHNTTVDVGGTNTGSDIGYDAAIAYNGDFGGVNVGADVAYHLVDNGGTNGSAAENREAVRAGVSVATAGFTVAGSILEVKNVNTVKDQDGQSWNIGVSYATGPYGVSLSYMNVEIEQDATSNDEDSEETWMLSGSYDMGAGVSLRGSVFAAEYDDASATGTNNVGDNEGFGVVGGLNVSF